MLSNLPLRWRLSLLLGAMLALGLSLGVALLTLHAGSRIRAEAEAATRLARDFVETALAQARGSAAPSAELDRLLAQGRTFRHLRIYVEGAEPPPAGASRAPSWFAALATPRASVAMIEMTEPLHGALLIATNPADEIAEIWEEIVALAVGGGLVALAAFGLIFVAVTRTLAPVSALAEGLARLEQGERSLRVARGGSPELVAIADGINALAASLARLDEEHHRLLRRMIHVRRTSAATSRAICTTRSARFCSRSAPASAPCGARPRAMGSSRTAPGSTRRSPRCNRSTAVFWRACAPPRSRNSASPAGLPRWRRVGARAIPGSR